MEEIIIAIDGPAGVGKTTVSKALAQKLGIVYVDTGAMYRAVALVIKENNISIKNNPLKLREIIGQLDLSFVSVPVDPQAPDYPETQMRQANEFHVFLGQRDISGLIRTPEIDMLSSKISKIKEVREELKQLQRLLAKRFKKAIFEGRDIGTVVFPNAFIKFFLTASPEIRAERRWRQLKAKGENISYSEVLESLLKRDRQDMERKIAPLKPADDAIVIDTSCLSINEVVAKIEFFMIKKWEVDVMDKLEPEMKENTPGQDASVKDSSNGDMPELIDLYQETMKAIEPGQIVTGRVVYIGKDYAMIDIGLKSEGSVPLAEFRDADGKVKIQEGDEVEVYFNGIKELDGSVSLSRRKVVQIRTWEKIKRLYEDGGYIHGKIIKRVKGGYTVDVGVPAFLPGSQVDVKPVGDYDRFVGKVFAFKIIKYDPKVNNVILSRRQYLEEERERQKQQTLSRLKEGAVVYGRVKGIMDYGVFVDLGGIDGLLHIKDISWGKVRHPEDLFEIGDEIRVKVLKFDREKEKIALGMKQLTPDPWENVSEKYPVGSRIKGRVTNLTDYGVFLHIEDGVEGFIHISDLTWSKRLKHPSEVVSVGDVIEGIVLKIDHQRRRIHLGLKQIEPDPWDVIAEKYPVGSVIEGKVKNVTDFGVFVEVFEGIDGLVHVSDISWTKRVKHPKDAFKKGEVIKVKVLSIDKKAEKIALGIKQLQPDPWEEVPQKFPLGSVVSGEITHITDFGMFVEVEDGIEGLVHISEASLEKIKKLSDKFQVGDKVRAKVIKVDPEKRKLGLSIRQILEEEEKKSLYKYSSGNKGIMKLGELVKSKANLS